MALCTAFLLGLQLYWNYQAYRNSVKSFKSETNDALDMAIDRLTNIRKDQMAAEYKKWMADTNLIVISCKYDTIHQVTLFNIKDKFPLYGEHTGTSLSLDAIKEKINLITPNVKRNFINHFVNGNIYNQLNSKSVFFITQRLGNKLDSAFKNDQLNIKQLESLYKDELLKRDITTNYHFYIKNYVFKKFGEVSLPSKGYSFATRFSNYGFRVPLKAICAWFPDPNLVFLGKMKWILVSSLILIGITIFCFTYTVKTIFKQKKLTELKNEFVNNMTHELKTPVATINIAAEAIQDFNLSKESANEYLGIIRYQSSNLAQLIDQILKSVVMEQEMTILNITKTDVNNFVRKVLLEFAPQINKANATVNFMSIANDILINIDEALFKNALINLLDNALKYGGIEPVINISVRVYKEDVLISVADNGPGIPLQYQDKIFERFFRVPSGNLHNVKGYGLGLSYAKSIAELHSGSLKMISNLDNGTEFIITIPYIYNETSYRTTA